MIFAFLREEFYGSFQSLALLDSPVKTLVGQVDIQKIGFPAKLCRGMGIGIGDKPKAIQGGDTPVHGRIGGQACFQRMDLGAEISEAFLHRVKAGERAEQGKMRRPDMGRHINGPGTQLQYYFQQITAV